jgi:hypothetical protein
MIAHHVLFWLKADTPDEQKQAFRAGLQTLEQISTVKSFHIGTPSVIERSVVDRSYTFSLLLFFDSLEAHDAYQVDELHKTFLENFRSLFEKVIIYDAEG